MRNFKYIILLILTLSSITIVQAQQKTVVRGRVVDKADKSPVIGANVIEYDKDNRIVNGTVCDINGDFVYEIKNLTNTLKVSFIGYATQEIKVDPSRVVTIELEAETHKIDEVVVTGIAQTKRHSLTNLDDRDIASSSVKIELKDMKESGALSVADALQGKVSGLDILSASGDPGSGSRITIRGLSSIGNSKPLIVIDGIPISNPPNYSDVNLGSANAEDIGTLISISVQDIKSVEVLKDAGATARYGSRGADGVLLIETYSGRKGKVKVDYTYKRSLNIQPPAIPMLNGNEYIMLQQEEWHNRDGVYSLRPELNPSTDNAYIYNNYSKNTDWIGAITQNANTDDHYISIQGGGEKASYITSFSFINEGGTTINTGSKTLNNRVKLDYILSKNITFNINFNYSHVFVNDNFAPNGRNIREMAYIKAPNMSIWEYDANGKLTGEYFTPKDSYQGDGYSYFNPVAVAEKGRNDKVSNALSNSFSVRFKLYNWLQFEETASIEITGSKKNAFLSDDAVGGDWLSWYKQKGDEQNGINQAFKTMSQFTYFIPFTNVKHQVTGVFTWNTEQSRYEDMTVQSNKLPSADIQDPSINGQINWIGSNLTENKFLEGVLAANYKYDDKYLLQTTLVRDAHTAFGSNNRWGTFGSVSLAWRFSKENFAKNWGFLGESKIRASWGVVGRQPWDNYARFARYGDPSTYQYFNDGGYYYGSGLPKTYNGYLTVVPTQIQLSNLKWESTRSYTLGLELNMFHDKLNATFEVYKKFTTDLLFSNYTLPSSSGYQTLKFFNGGQLNNLGWEIQGNYKFININDLMVALDFNVSQNQNTFLKLPANFNNEKSTSINNGEYPKIIVPGEPIGSFYGFKYLGVYATDADAVAKNASGDIINDAYGDPIPMTYKNTYIFRGGDAKYADLNHDGKIDINDVTYIGNSNPKFYGGFGPTVRYKNLTVSLGFQFRVGYDIVNNIALQTQGMNDYNNQSKAVLRRWRAQGQDAPDILPRAYLSNPANNLGSDRYVERGDFLRLINTQIGYRLKATTCEKIHLRTLSFTLSARKIATFTRYTGQDPEISQNASDPFWIGVDNSRTPPPRIITFAVSIGI